MDKDELSVTPTVISNIYVKGCPSNPDAVINRLIACGGISQESLSPIDLCNPHNVFYIDITDSNKIKFMSDDCMIWDTLSKYWMELPPLTEVSKLPESWDEALENCIEAENFDNGNDDTTNNLLEKYGRLLVLRDIWRKGWVPSNDGAPFWYIANHNNELDVMKGTSISRPFAFNSRNTTNAFLVAFEHELNEIKDLL